MAVKLTDGVTLHVLPTKKFKTVRIKIKLKAPLHEDNITSRALLASLLETNSQKYPTQTAMRSELSRLYGASFYTDVTKKGTAHILTLDLNVVNDKFLSESDSVLNQSVAFLEEVLFRPNVQEGAFHEETFNRERENLRDEYSSYYDDKQLYAALALQELYFDDPAQQIPSRGREEDLEKITPRSLYKDYQKMLQEDIVDILVVGDVTEDELAKAFRIFSFSPRKEAVSQVFYAGKQGMDKKEKTEIHPVAQAKLNLAYDTGVYYHAENYYAGQVFNGLFGGYPHSKLFTNVREKESLAYYASSFMDTFRGMMTVETGIEETDASKVERIIAQQLKELQNGQFEEEAFLQTKEMLKNGLYQSEDSPGGYLERVYANLMAKGKIIPLDEWIEKIDQVTKADVQDIAQKVSLKARFLLKGENN